MRTKLLDTNGLSTTSLTARIDVDKQISLRGDIRAIGVHIENTPTFSAGSGNTLQFLRRFALMGNGSHAVYDVKNYSATVESLPDIHRRENAMVTFNQALSTTNLTEAKVMFNCSRMRALWGSMTLKIESYLPSELGLTCTVNGLAIKVIIYYAMAPFSTRVKCFMSPSTTAHAQKLPSNEGVLMGVLLKTSTANYITNVSLEDPKGATVINGDFDTLQIGQQNIDKQTATGDGANMVHFDIPDMALDENTILGVTLSTAEALQIVAWFKSALQTVKDGSVEYRDASYGAVPPSATSILSLKTPKEQIAFMRSQPFATVLSGQGANIEQRDNLQDRN